MLCQVTFDRSEPLVYLSPQPEHLVARRLNVSVTASVEEVAANLRKIIAGLGPGDEVAITEGDRTIAKLVLEHKPKQRPGPGLCKGMITIVSDDDEHLKDFQEYMP